MSLTTVIRDLHRRKARERRGLALAEGIRLVEEMLGAGVACNGALISPTLETTPRGAALVEELLAHRIGVEKVTDRELTDAAATEHPQGVVAVYQPRVWSLAEVAPGPQRPVVVLDAVQDPGNVGTIARTALALGASGIVALPGTADLTNPKVVRSAAGALFRLPGLLVEEAQMLEWLTDRNVPLWVSAADGEPLEHGDHPTIALALGNEGGGVRRELLAVAARRVSIPIRSEAESLNVAVAAGLLLDRLRR